MNRAPYVFIAAMIGGLLCSIHALGQEPRQMTSGVHREVDPMISPDGNMLAFASDQTGNHDIYIFDYRTGGTYQVTESPKDDRYPSWSPDNSKILFSSKRTGGGDIYEVSAKGRSGYLQLSDQKGMEEFPSYAPKGKGLLFARAVARNLIRHDMRIVFQDDASLAPGIILADGDEPRFSPDGKRIVFVSRRTKDNEIWIMNADGSMQTQLTSSPGDDINPSFSPDGSQIIFATKRTGNLDLYVMDATGGSVRQLTADPADEMQPSWSREDYIYFTKRQGAEGKSAIWRMKAPK